MVHALCLAFPDPICLQYYIQVTSQEIVSCLIVTTLYPNLIQEFSTCCSSKKFTNDTIIDATKT